MPLKTFINIFDSYLRPRE